MLYVVTFSGSRCCDCGVGVVDCVVLSLCVKFISTQPTTGNVILSTTAADWSQTTGLLVKIPHKVSAEF